MVELGLTSAQGGCPSLSLMTLCCSKGCVVKGSMLVLSSQRFLGLVWTGTRALKAGECSDTEMLRSLLKAGYDGSSAQDGLCLDFEPSN